MTPDEQEILDEILQYNQSLASGKPDVKLYEKLLFWFSFNWEMAFDMFSEEFIQSPLLQNDFLQLPTEEYISQTSLFHTIDLILDPSLQNEVAKQKTKDANTTTKQYFKLWLSITKYYLTKTDETAEQKLRDIQTSLDQCFSEFSSEQKHSTRIYYPKKLLSRKFIKNIYALDDEPLSLLFSKYLPVPGAELFIGQVIPQLIRKRINQSYQVLYNFLNYNAQEGKALRFIRHTKQIQRNYRAKRREKEWIQLLENQHRVNEQKVTQEEVKFIIRDANQPYLPKCATVLATNIREAAKQIVLFLVVSHLTTNKALVNIFNHGLLGRRTLQQFFMPFKPASLSINDMFNGDDNVICLGSRYIDPQSNHGIELKFDAKKIAEKNPCFFFKQKDFGFNPEIKRTIKVGDYTLSFTHVSHKKLGSFSTTLFTISDENHSPATAEITNTALVSNNFEEMHQILILNFFRYIDNLVDENHQADPYYKNKIYDALGKLDAKELIDTLKIIGNNISDTMEFNFYGAYEIDFSALQSITMLGSTKNLERNGSSIYLEEFIAELNKGNLQPLNHVRQALPEILQSSRFMNYLYSKIFNNIALNALQHMENTNIVLTEFGVFQRAPRGF